MRALGIVGVLLIVCGAIVMILGGVSYVKDRDKVDLGIVKITKTDKGFITPTTGAIVLVAGVVLLVVGRGRGRA